MSVEDLVDGETPGGCAWKLERKDREPYLLRDADGEEDVREDNGAEYLGDDHTDVEDSPCSSDSMPDGEGGSMNTEWYVAPER